MHRKKDLKVLLIDDDEEDFLLTRDILSEVSVRKYELDWANNYESGMEEIRKRQHDVYLIDYRLGVDTGLDLIRQATSEGYYAPMLLLTGQGDQAIDEQAMELGAADYLIKGAFDAALLDRSIRYSIIQYKMLQEVRMLHEQSEQKVQERTHELAETVKQLEHVNSALIKHINERRHVEDALRESQTMLMTMATNFPQGTIALIDRNWKYIFIQGRALKTIGFRSEELIGQDIRQRVRPDQVSIIEGPTQRAFEGESDSYEINVHNRHFICFTMPLPDAQGNIDRVMIVSQDITERKTAEEEIKAALQKEKHLNELKSRFVSMASHEFRTPLATILSSVALIGRYNNPEDFDKRLKHINRVRAAVTNMTETLNDFLSLDKLDEGMIHNQPVPFDLPEFFTEAKEEISMLAKEDQSIRLEMDGSELNRPILLDKQLLRNVLNNLLSNAIKYSPEHSEILLSVSTQDSRLKIEVTDQGIGIPAEDQKHIFNTFFRANNAMNIQGTGLGLNIVKKYLDLMNGDIHFVSEMNKGTTFTVTIPINSLQS